MITCLCPCLSHTGVSDGNVVVGSKVGCSLHGRDESGHTLAVLDHLQYHPVLKVLWQSHLRDGLSKSLPAVHGAGARKPWQTARGAEDSVVSDPSIRAHAQYVTTSPTVAAGPAVVFRPSRQPHISAGK
jgi:hypothetical protein